MNPVGLFPAAHEIQEVEQLGVKSGAFQIHSALARRLENAPLVPNALAHQNADGLPAFERAQVFVPGDADRTLRLLRQRMFGIRRAIVFRPIAVVDDQHVLVRAVDVAQAVVRGAQAGIDREVRELRRPDLVSHLFQRLLQPAAQVHQVEAGGAEEDALAHRLRF